MANTKLRFLSTHHAGLRARKPHRTPRGRMRAFGVKKKRYLFALPLLLILIVLAAWIKAPAMTVNRFRPVSSSLINPLMGWAVDASIDPESVEIPHSLVYARLRWRDFEPEEGVYDFDAFERVNHLNQWFKAGKHLILRFVMDVPDDKRHLDIPDWLYDLMGADAGLYYENEYGMGFSPNYTHLLLMEKHQAALNALAQRYDAHPSVAFIELGSLGHNGSWTVGEMQGEGWPGEGMPPSQELRSWVWSYVSAFPNTTLMASAPYQPVRATGLGLYNDNLGIEDATWNWLDTLEYGGYDASVGVELRSMPGFYNTVPSGAHIADSVHQPVLLAHGANAFLRQVRASHLTYVSGIQATELTDGMQNGIAAAHTALGYRLWIREASWPDSIRNGYRLSVDLDVRNDGTQPFSQRWPVQFALFDDAGANVFTQTSTLDVRTFLPGAQRVTARLDIPHDFTPGNYRLAVVILDPANDEIGVTLPMNAPKIGYWAVLGALEVTN